MVTQHLLRRDTTCRNSIADSVVIPIRRYGQKETTPHLRSASSRHLKYSASDSAVAVRKICDHKSFIRSAEHWVRTLPSTAIVQGPRQCATGHYRCVQGPPSIKGPRAYDNVSIGSVPYSCDTSPRGQCHQIIRVLETPRWLANARCLSLDNDACCIIVLIARVIKGRTTLNVVQFYTYIATQNRLTTSPCAAFVTRRFKVIWPVIRLRILCCCF